MGKAKRLLNEPRPPEMVMLLSSFSKMQRDNFFEKPLRGFIYITNEFFWKKIPYYNLKEESSSTSIEIGKR